MQQSCNSSPLSNSVVTCKSPVEDISAATLIRTDTTLDHSQKAEKVRRQIARWCRRHRRQNCMSKFGARGRRGSGCRPTGWSRCSCRSSILRLICVARHERCQQHGWLDLHSGLVRSFRFDSGAMVEGGSRAAGPTLLTSASFRTTRTPRTRQGRRDTTLLCNREV